MFGFIKWGGNISAWVVAIANIVIFTLMSMVIPQFTEIFSQYGSELPEFTVFMLYFHNYTSLFGGLGLLGALLIQLNHHQSGWVLIGISSSIVFATIVLTVIGMYLPIFTMGQVVS